MQWLAETYGWDFDTILWRIPASAAALMRRQWLKASGIEMVDLSEIEDIDNGRL